MSRLEELYDAIHKLENLGIPITEEQRKNLDFYEEQFIKNEVLPAISDDLMLRLSPIQRNLVLVVEYTPGHSVSVALSRKTKIRDVADAKPLTPVVDSPNIEKQDTIEVSYTSTDRHIENPTKGLRVTFPDGEVICEKTAKNTYLVTLQKIGLNKIATLDITCAGYKIVSHKKRNETSAKGHSNWQEKIGDWYIYTNLSNKRKMEFLQRISEHFQLNLHIAEAK